MDNEDIDLTGAAGDSDAVASASSSAASKKRKVGRPPGVHWQGYTQIELKEKGAGNRNWSGKCNACGLIVPGKSTDLNAHKADCNKSGNAAQLSALVNSVKAGGGTVADSKTDTAQAARQQSLAGYADRQLSSAQNKQLQRMLCLAFVLNGWSFRSVQSPKFVAFLKAVRPSFEPPGQQAVLGA